MHLGLWIAYSAYSRWGKLHTSVFVDSEVRSMEEWWALLVQEHHVALEVSKSAILRKKDPSPEANTRTGYVTW